MFKNEYIIKRNQTALEGIWSDWTPGTSLYQAILNGCRRDTWFGFYRDVEYEKTPVINPLYEPYTKDLPVAKWIRTYFLSTDRPQYRYYEFVKQLFWIVMAAGLVLVYFRKKNDDDFHFLSLAVFGGLLF